MKKIIILLVLTLSAALVYAGNGDLIVENGKVGVGTSTPNAKLTVSGTIDPSTLTYSVGMLGTPASKYSETTLSGAIDVSSSKTISGNVDYLNISGAGNYSYLTAYGYQQYVTNNNPYTRSLNGIYSITENWASIATGTPSIYGLFLVGAHRGAGTVGTVLGCPNRSSTFDRFLSPSFKTILLNAL